MKEEYNFSNARKNPYAKKLKKQVTINLDNDTIGYFKEMARTSGIPYQTAAALAAAVFGFVLLVLCFSMRFVHMQHVFIKGID